MPPVVEIRPSRGNMKMKILGISGSLRKDSFNRKLLQAAIELAPEGMEIEIFDRLGEIPFYNEDVEERGDPESVIALKKSIESADALLIATPEYNYSVPGALKNAIDWASRPPAPTVLNDKACGIIGASQGTGGTIRSQLALRQMLGSTNSPVLLKPETFIAKAQDKFGTDGKLTDESTRKHLASFLKKFSEWIVRSAEVQPSKAGQKKALETRSPPSLS